VYELVLVEVAIYVPSRHLGPGPLDFRVVHWFPESIGVWKVLNKAY